MLGITYLVIFTLSLVEFNQALISCNKTNVEKTQLCLVDEYNLDIYAYADAIEVADPLEIKTALTLISIAEVRLPLICVSKKFQLSSNHQNPYRKSTNICDRKL
jgi:hypothetical protein